jgi:hypothetical protein
MRLNTKNADEWATRPGSHNHDGTYGTYPGIPFRISESEIVPSGRDDLHILFVLEFCPQGIPPPSLPR